MSDLDRNYASPFGRAAVGRADAAAVDAGLRAYMLRIYNYMSIGLAITGLAALGVYMAAVTGDPSAAAARIGNAYLTAFGVALFVGPLKWLFIFAPLVMVFAISAGINRFQPATSQPSASSTIRAIRYAVSLSGGTRLSSRPLCCRPSRRSFARRTASSCCRDMSMVYPCAKEVAFAVGTGGACRSVSVRRRALQVCSDSREGR